MPYRAGWFSLNLNCNTQRNFFWVAGSATALCFRSWSQPLRNDSTSQAQWPSTRPSIDDRSKDHPVKDDANVPLFEDDDDAAWASFSASVSQARSSLSAIDWSSLGDRIADTVVPEWAHALPGYVAKIQGEIDMGSGSLAEEIWQEAQDPYAHPEIAANARVRVGKDICAEEIAFVQRRKRYTTRALAKYLELPEADVDPRDVPTIAICGSGGGLRALVAGASSYLSAQQAGLFECTTYTAGVSGSCWLQTLYNSSLGGRRHEKVIDHLKRRIGTHIAYPPAFLDLMTRAPTNKYLLSGTIEKLKGDPQSIFGLVDVYGLLLATRLMIPRDELSVDHRDLKLSNQRTHLQQGANPMPIYAAVRHEIPIEEVKGGKKIREKALDAVKQEAKKEAWFQWFEFTPYEMWCEELDAGIPSWSIGRHFDQGRTKTRDNGYGLPELRIPFLMGIWGSAFCATLAHYYKEIRPVVKGLAGFGGIDEMIEGKNEELVKLHPIDPGAIPNYVLGLRDVLPSSCPESIFKDPYLDLMDAGMSNNLPLYPLLRQGRDVDIIVCFDASADIKQENWLSVADGYVKQRGIKGWPVGAGWPKQDTNAVETNEELDAADATTAQQAAGKIAEAREAQRETGDSNSKQDIPPKTNKPTTPNQTDLGYCNIWVGTTTTTETPPSKRVDPNKEDWLLTSPTAGITVIYFPFMANPKVSGVDPNTSPFMSTWNFIYTPEEIDKVVALARANFDEGKEQTKRTVRAVYERKKARRLEVEGEGRIRRWKAGLREAGDHFV